MKSESKPQMQQAPAADQVGWYEWMVLALASAGWLFDVFEGQLFGSCMKHALPILTQRGLFPVDKELAVNLGLGSFLVGGAAGGLLFGMLADRWGRKRVMALTILMYSLFTGITALSQDWIQLTLLRFLVGMGVGGEWAVAAAIVAEVFPQRLRPVASGIFHASSVLGTYMAVGALFLVGYLTERFPEDGWRFGFLLGVVPALLILWVRVIMREPESWQEAKAAAKRDRSKSLGRVQDLFSSAVLTRNTLIGTTLGIIGLATFWGGHFRGRDVIRNCDAYTQRLALADDGDTSAAKIDDTRNNNVAGLGWFLITTGGGIGLLSFAPISQRIGRRAAFVVFHLGAFALTAVFFGLSRSLVPLLIVSPVFGFFTLGMHAGYAVYFPELFPTRLRSTGASFCFNMARLIVMPTLLVFAFLQSDGLGFSLEQAILAMGSLFLVGAVVALLGPETRGQPLPE